MRAVLPPAPRDVAKHSVIYTCSLVIGTVVVFSTVRVTVWFLYCVTSVLVLCQQKFEVLIQCVRFFDEGDRLYLTQRSEILILRP
jgi:hypothetical protein